MVNHSFDVQRMPRVTLTDRMSIRLQHATVRHPYLWSMAIVALMTSTLWLVQQEIGVTNVSLFYLIAVLLCAATAGRAPAVVGALFSFLAFKFFFVEPIFSFTIDDISDIWQLCGFIAAALIGGAITIYAREQAAMARQHAREMTVLYAVSQSISTELDFTRIAPVIVETALDLLPCSASALMLNHVDGTQELCVSRGIWLDTDQRIEIPLRSGDQPLGFLRIGHAPQQVSLMAKQQQLLITLANQAALALERSRLAQIAAHAEALAEADRLKSILLSVVSHDLRTPLASITAAADELLAEDVQWTPATSRDFAQIIKTETTQLHSLVMNMLDQTRIDAGVLRPQRGWYNIAEIIYRVLQRFESRLEGRPLELQLPDDLPLIPVDFIQLEQVFWNILQNALTYAPAPAPLLITARQQDAMMVVSIADGGPGIPPEERVQVFEKFYRLPQAQQTHHTGAGLGLAICKGLIEAHDGQIRIDENAGGGTVVTICLPLQVDELHDIGE
jgi:two-component system sensor histidine kinase KdpD